MLSRILAFAIALSMPLSVAAQKKTTRRPAPSKPAARTAANLATASDEHDLVSLERRILDAIRDRESKELEPWIAEDFVYRDVTGKEMNREQFLESVKSFPHDIEWLSADNMRLRILGDIGIVTGVQQERMAPVEAGAVPKANTESITEQTAFTDVFRRRGADWELVLVYAAELPAKPAAPPAAPPR
jgi:hypothetical protein